MISYLGKESSIIYNEDGTMSLNVPFVTEKKLTQAQIDKITERIKKHNESVSAGKDIQGLPDKKKIDLPAIGMLAAVGLGGLFLIKNLLD